MPSDVTKGPVYDQRAQLVLEGLQSGKRREEIAAELSLKNHKCLDISMRRKGFVWDRHAGMYVAPEEQPHKLKNQPLSDLPKTRRVIQLFTQPGADPREVAVSVGFRDHRAMAEYMKSKGYAWDAYCNNYVSARGIAFPESMDLPEPSVSTPVWDEDETESTSVQDEDLIVYGRYESLLRFLDENIDRLSELLESSGSEPEAIPHYTIPGEVQPKTVRMKANLAQLVVDFAKARGLSQKAIFEAALVSFFRRYGYLGEADEWLRERK